MYRIQQSATGTEREIVANFSDGKADGKWTTISRKIFEGVVSDTLEYFTIHFSKGDLVGATSGRTAKSRFTGAFSPEGTLDGNWEFQSKTPETILRENRVYMNSVFTKHELGVGNKMVDFKHPGLVMDLAGVDTQAFEVVPLTAELFEALYETKLIQKGDFKELADKFQQSVRRSNEIMNQGLFAFGRENGSDIWARLGGSDPIPMPKVKLALFAFDSAELVALDRAAKSADQINKMLDAFFTDPQIDVGSYSYEEVALSKVVMKIYQEQFKALSGSILKFQNESYRFIHRGRYLDRVGPKLNFPESVEYEFKDSVRIRSWEFPDLNSKKWSHLSELTDALELIYTQMQASVEQVDQVLEDYRREKLLAEFEGKMIARRDSVHMLFSNTDGEKFNSYHEQLAEKVKTFAIQRFKTYAALKPEEKSEAAEEVLNCFANLIRLYTELEKQPLRMASLKEQYTRTIWNAYTFTYMDEIVKERLYRAFESELLPAITNDLINHLSCQQLEAKMLNYARSYRRMMELRETDTRLQERQLRRTPGYKSLIEIFEFDLNLGE
ncbi:MAG: hypothetical protein ACK417_01035 [Bacteroidia bacterium]